MLVPCSELLDRIVYELKDENDEPLSFIGNIYLLIGFTVIEREATTLPPGRRSLP